MSNSNTETTIIPTDEMIEAGAFAAWADYTGPFDPGWHPNRWPNTGLYPDADDFRSCAKACFIAMMEKYNEQN